MISCGADDLLRRGRVKGHRAQRARAQIGAVEVLARRTAVENVQRQVLVVFARIAEEFVAVRKQVLGIAGGITPVAAVAQRVRHDDVGAAAQKGFRARKIGGAHETEGVLPFGKFDRVGAEQEHAQALVLFEQRACLFCRVRKVEGDAHPPERVVKLLAAAAADLAEHFEDLVVDQRARLALERARVRAPARRKEHRRRKFVRALHFQTYARGEVFHRLVHRLTYNAAKRGGVEVVEQDDGALREAGENGRGKEGTLVRRIDVRAQGVDDHFGRDVRKIPLARVLVQVASRVGRQDDDGVFEGDLLVVMEIAAAAAFEDLQKELDDERVCLFDLVEQEDALGVALDERGHDAGLGLLIRAVDAVEGGERDLVVGVCAHVQPQEGAAQRRRGSLGEEGLSHARRPRKQAHRTRAGTRAFRAHVRFHVEDGGNKGVDRMVLPRDLFVQRRSELFQPRGELRERRGRFRRRRTLRFLFAFRGRLLRPLSAFGGGTVRAALSVHVFGHFVLFVLFVLCLLYVPILVKADFRFFVFAVIRDGFLVRQLFRAVHEHDRDAAQGFLVEFFHQETDEHLAKGVRLHRLRHRDGAEDRKGVVAQGNVLHLLVQPLRDPCDGIAVILKFVRKKPVCVEQDVCFFRVHVSRPLEFCRFTIFYHA